MDRFRTKLDLAKSEYFSAVVMAEEDPAPIYEVVLFIGDGSTEQREGCVEGIYVDCMQIEERKPLLDWLRELSTSSNAQLACASRRLLHGAVHSLDGSRRRATARARRLPVKRALCPVRGRRRVSPRL